MKLMPSIDVEGYTAVKRVLGIPGTGLVLGDPLRLGERLYSLGYTAVHVVDLDSAGRRRPRSYAIRLLRGLSRMGFTYIEYGGGVGSREAVADASSAGASAVVIGSAWLRDPSFAYEASGEASLHGSSILLAAEEDRDGFLVYGGWRRRSSLRVEDAARLAAGCGAAGLFYTQVWREGLMQGPCMCRALHVLSAARGLRVVYSGGVSSDRDVELLLQAGFDGVVAGMAFYTGRLTMERWARGV